MSVSKSNVEKITKRLVVSKEMLQKKRLEVSPQEKKSNPELRRLKKIVRRVANKRRRALPVAPANSGKEA